MRKFIFVKKCWSLILRELKHFGFEIILKIKSTSIFWAPGVCKALAHSVFSPSVSWLLLLKWTWMTREVTLCLCKLGHFCPGSSESQRLSQPWKGNAVHLWTLLHYYFYSYKLKLKYHRSVTLTPWLLTIWQLLKWFLSHYAAKKQWGHEVGSKRKQYLICSRRVPWE